MTAQHKQIIAAFVIICLSALLIAFTNGSVMNMITLLIASWQVGSWTRTLVTQIFPD